MAGGAAMARAARFAACVVGIYASYLTQGVLQERVSTERYGASGARFEHMVFLNLAQAVVCYAVAQVLLLLLPPKPGGSGLLAFWKPSISNTVGPALGTVALRNISYPAQVLVKSGKVRTRACARTHVHTHRLTHTHTHTGARAHTCTRA